MGGTSSDIPCMPGWVWASPAPAREPKEKGKKDTKAFFACSLRVCAKPGFRSKFRISTFILKEVPTTSIRDILSDAAAAGSVGPSFLGASLEAKFKHADHCLFQ